MKQNCYALWCKLLTFVAVFAFGVSAYAADYEWHKITASITQNELDAATEFDKDVAVSMLKEKGDLPASAFLIYAKNVNGTSGLYNAVNADGDESNQLTISTLQMFVGMMNGNFYYVTGGEAKTTDFSFDFKEIDFKNGWTTSYDSHTVKYDQAGITVDFDKADKQNAGGTIDNMPVIKGGKVTVTASSGKISRIKFYCKQWGAKTQTLIIKAGEDKDLLEDVAIGDADVFELEAIDLNASIAQLTFSSASNQVGVEKMEVSLVGYTEPAVLTFTPAGGTYYEAPTVKITSNVSVTKIEYSLDGENWNQYDDAGVTVNKSATLSAKAYNGANVTTEKSEEYVIAEKYNSLEELMAVEAAGQPVSITVTDMPIDSIYVTNQSKRNGILTQVGEDWFEVFCYDVPEEWEIGGTVSGTINGQWKDYKGQKEICPLDWDWATYKAPTPEPVLPTGYIVDVAAEKTDALTASDTQWYVWTQCRNGETPVYDTGLGEQVKRKAVNGGNVKYGDKVEDVNTMLVRFVKSQNYPENPEVFNIQFATGNYVGAPASGTSVPVVSDTPMDFCIYNAKQKTAGWTGHFGFNRYEYDELGQRLDNNGANNTVSFWGSSTRITEDTNNVWALYPVSIDAELPVTPEMLAAAEKAAKDAADVYAKTQPSVHPVTGKLITDAGQLYCNNIDPSDGQGLPGVIDGNANTYMHTNYHDAGEGPHYLRVSLPDNTYTQMILKYTNRKADNDIVKTMKVYGSNDGGETYSDELMTVNMPNTSSSASGEVVLNLGETPYTCYRFDVTDCYPSYRIFWHMAEFQLFGAENSAEYDVDPALAEALQTAINNLDAKIANKTVTQEDIDAVNNAAEAVKNALSFEYTIRIVGDPTGEAKAYIGYGAYGDGETVSTGALAVDDVTGSPVDNYSSTVAISEDRVITVTYMLSNAAGLANDAVYTITCKRGQIHYKEGSADEAVNVFGEAIAEDCEKFALIKTQAGNIYMYNAGGKKFIADDQGGAPSISDVPVHAVEVNPAEGNVDYPFYFTSNTHYFNIGGNQKLIVSTWSTLDDGNQFKIMYAGTYDLTAAVAAAEEFEHPTPTELVNPGFDVAEDFVAPGICTYAKDTVSNGTQYSRMVPVTGWTIAVEDGDARAAGAFRYGGGSWLGGVGYTVPDTDKDGRDGGGVLGLLGVWTGQVQYTQKVKLPAGKYTLAMDIYNQAGTEALVNNLFGVIFDKEGVENHEYAATTQYPVGEWKTEMVPFELDKETIVTVSLGMVAPNKGSGGCQHLFVDNVRFETGISRDMLVQAYNIAKKVVDAKINIGDALFQIPESAYDELAQVLDEVKAVVENEAATSEEIEAAYDKLMAATAKYDESVNAPDPAKNYALALNGTEGNLGFQDEGIKLVANAAVKFEQSEVAGEFHIRNAANENEYVGYAGTNPWSLTTDPDKKEPWLFTLTENGYTISGKNGLLGTNANEKTAGVSFWGNKTAEDGNVYYTISEISNKEALAALKNLIDEAEALVNTLPEGEKKTNLQNAIDSAKEVYNKQDAATFADIEAASTALQTAINEATSADLAEGEYYLYNAEGAGWLGGANSWGTQASLVKHAQIFNVTLSNGKYAFDSHTYNNGNTDHFLGSNLYVDAPKTEWKVENGETEGIYRLSVNGDYLASAEGSTVLVSTLDAAAAGAQWSIMSRAAMLETLGGATEAKPVDATWLIKAADFSRNLFNRDQEPVWTIEADNCNISGGDAGEDAGNNCAESWQSAFDVYQTLTELPNGWYTLNAQAALTDYTDAYDGTDYPVLYANEETSVFNSMDEADRGTNMHTLSKSFTAGKYQVEPIMVEVTEGTLRVGVKGTRTNTWCIWDNFELEYLGTETPTPVGIDGVNVNGKTVINTTGQYNIAGQKVGAAYKGVIIVNGKKVLVK